MSYFPSVFPSLTGKKQPFLPSKKLHFLYFLPLLTLKTEELFPLCYQNVTSILDGNAKKYNTFSSIRSALCKKNGSCFQLPHLKSIAIKMLPTPQAAS